MPVVQTLLLLNFGSTLKALYNTSVRSNVKYNLFGIFGVTSLVLDVLVCELYAFDLKLCDIFVLNNFLS